MLLRNWINERKEKGDSDTVGTPKERGTPPFDIMQPLQRFTPVKPQLINEWFTLCCLETHQRQWIYTLEEMNSVSMIVAESVLRIERRLCDAQDALKTALDGVNEYAELMDDCDMKTRQIMTTLRERQFLLEKCPSREPSRASKQQY